MSEVVFGGVDVTFGGIAVNFGATPLEGVSNLLTDSFNTLALTLDNETVDETGDGATLTIDSNSDAGTLYSYSKTTAFTGTDEENAAEIIANGVGQTPVVGENTRVVDSQDSLTPHYAGWVQDAGTVESNVVLVQYTTLDTPVAPVQTAPYNTPATRYVDEAIAEVDAGNPFWYSNAGAMTFAMLPDTPVPGLTFSSEGIFTGTPTTVGSYPRHITATNSVDTTVSAEQIIINIIEMPVVDPADGSGLSLSLSLWI